MMRSEVTARMAIPMAASAGNVKPSHANTRCTGISSFFLIASTTFGSQYNWLKNRTRIRNAANTERTAKRFPQSVVRTNEKFLRWSQTTYTPVTPAIPRDILAILENEVSANAAILGFRDFLIIGDNRTTVAMIPPIQASLKKRWTKFINTPNAGAKVEAAAWLIRARAKSISASAPNSAYSMVEIRSAENKRFRATWNAINRKATPSMR